MRIRFTDYPEYISQENYQISLNKFLNKLIYSENMVSIYQIGSIRDPGISDIDIVIVFKDGAEYPYDPIKGMSELDKYMFCHRPYGISQTDFISVQKFTFFHNYKLLSGKQLLSEKNIMSTDETQKLKAQIALEFLLKMYINLTLSRTYRMYRIRELLLHIKGILYDLEFLHSDSGDIYDIVTEIVNWRKRWFVSYPTETEMLKKLNILNSELNQFLDRTINIYGFYAPNSSNLRVASNIRLINADATKYIYKGYRLPSIFNVFGSKYFNIQNRFVYFQFHLPISTNEIPTILQQQFEFFRHLKKMCNSNYNHFMPMTTSLNLY
ncbi:hypothetical protein ACFLR7_00270 [Acidobacteriota bacterium]